MIDLLANSHFTAWGGDLDTDTQFPRVLIEGPFYLEAYFVNVTTPTPEPTATPTPSPTPTFTPEQTPTPDPTPIEGIGNVWLSPPSIQTNLNSSITTWVNVNSGYQQLAAYGFDIIYDQAMLQVDGGCQLRAALFWTVKKS